MIGRVVSGLLTPVRDGTLRRFLFMAAVAFWLGGFTFYSAVVIHVGARVLHSQMKQGLVTQRVTDWLNFAGALALPIMLWNTAAIWRHRGRVSRALLAITWAVMAAVQVELALLHPVLDHLLEPPAATVASARAGRQFDDLHFVYLMSSTAQWAAGLIHVWCAAAGHKT